MKLKVGETKIFNLGNANGFSVREVIETAKLVTEKPIKLTQCDHPLGQPPILVSSGEKSEEVRAGTLNTQTSKTLCFMSPIGIKDAMNSSRN